MRLVLEGDTVKFEPDFKDFEVSSYVQDLMGFARGHLIYARILHVCTHCEDVIRMF